MYIYGLCLGTQIHTKDDINFTFRSKGIHVNNLSAIKKIFGYCKVPNQGTDIKIGKVSKTGE